MTQLTNLRVAVLATDGFEEAELTEPVKALKEAGAQVEILSTKSGEIQAFRHNDKGITVSADRELDQAQASEYDAVLLPGGALNADTLRMGPKVQSFLQEMQQAGKPFAVICHAAWELISANLVQGRTLTSYYTIQDDIRNAGGNWVDKEVVVDGNWVTSRQPDDIPAFNQEMLNLFAQFAPAASGSH
ncbi:MAG: type 1 glutamine amidotransferase domain-containing protein [Nostoc sp. DedVER02]|uniref:type 1 glutamine amidotransferase domain-containing protein n=1 Tax=unclassified Nostoc TaxID=2593658 RepID=UPI002AD3633D|nr:MULTISPECIES: type 1 glutamine amidotransferase domain-containing protein [unclassified Nostoc]MDZ7985882.1 type 1 glutamine amidotransferase domain-containing protein [Nostoc sp. DedVER02]MDZ8111560.1 type 1 glutamine amidotransferase domain-containing protein [Nostoc sp. DedVER01b]